MKKILGIVFATLVTFSCSEEKVISSINPENWGNRKAIINTSDSLISGTSYLSVYSQIYSQTEHMTHDLTATVSMRNTSRTDSIFITKTEYFDTKGKLIRVYFEDPIFIAPMETVEIVIDEIDRTGGTGANFMFDWKIKPEACEPLFEGVMLSTLGHQGLSFTTHGKRVK